MTVFQRLAVALTVLVASTHPALAADPPSSKVTTENDVVYSKVGDNELKLDIARPAEGDGPFPAVFVIHGGAWRQGNKSDTRPALAEFAKRGYVAVSPQYRFCPKERFPAQVHDAKAAVRWIKAHAKDYKVDPMRIGAMGFSAGGHLALMLGLTAPADGLEGEISEGSPDSKVQAVVNYFGPTDLAANDFPDFTKPLIRDFIGGPASDKPEETAKASPLTHVSKDDAPVLTFHGTKDPLLPHSQAVKLADALTAAGVPGRVELLVGEGHGWGDAVLRRTQEESYAFFDKYLKPSKSETK